MWWYPYSFLWPIECTHGLTTTRQCGTSTFIMSCWCDPSGIFLRCLTVLLDRLALEEREEEREEEEWEESGREEEEWEESGREDESLGNQPEDMY